MGLLNSALQIGRSAILGYQGALQTVGDNISNAASPDHSRLTPVLVPVQGTMIAGGLQPGAGVALTNIQRNIDEALESRLRLAIGTHQAASVRQVTLARLEAGMDGLSGGGIGSRLAGFFHSFDELQNHPEDPATRDLVLSHGAQLALSLRGLREQMLSLAGDLDGDVSAVLTRADQIATEIARLNGEITTLESGRRGQATALRDQRDGLLRELSTLFDVTVREQPDGAVNVYVGNEALVQGSVSRGLVAVTESTGTISLTTVRFADTNQEIDVRGGALAGLLVSRDRLALGRLEDLDRLAATLIDTVNRIHADGQGLAGFAGLEGTFDLLATNAALGDPAAGLGSAVRDGSFFITVADDATGTPVAHRIDVVASGDGAMSLEDLVTAINDQVSGVTASITSDNRLALRADGGYTFTFGHDGQQARADSSGVLAALGMNTFFTGSDARNIAVSESLRARPELLAAGSVFLPGDGANAGRLAGLDSAMLEELNGVSLVGFYQRMSNGVATDAAAAIADAESADAVQAALFAQREAISGVNLDEEAISLVKFQRAYQGSARYITVVDELISTLIALIR